MYIVRLRGDQIPSEVVKKLPWFSGGRNFVLQESNIQLFTFSVFGLKPMTRSSVRNGSLVGEESSVSQRGMSHFFKFGRETNRNIRFFHL